MTPIAACTYEISANYIADQTVSVIQSTTATLLSVNMGIREEPPEDTMTRLSVSEFSASQVLKGVTVTHWAV